MGVNEASVWHRSHYHLQYFFYLHTIPFFFNENSCLKFGLRESVSVTVLSFEMSVLIRCAHRKRNTSYVPIFQHRKAKRFEL